MTSPAISVRGVTKRYGTLAAVDEVTLEVGAGEVYALLGLNGAGKTTLIRMLLGMVRPTAGTLELAGRPVTDRSVWAQVGYLVETPSAYPDLTVRENLEVARRLRRLPGRGRGRRRVGPVRAQALRDLEGAHAVAGQRATAGAGQGAPAPAPDPGARRTGQRPGPGRCRGDPHHAHRPRPRRRGHRPAVQPPAGRGGAGRDPDRHPARRSAHRGAGQHDPGGEHPHPAGGGRAGTSRRAAAILRGAGFVVQQLAVDTLVLEGRAVLHPEEVATALVEGGEPPTRLVVVDEDLEGHFMRLVGHHADAAGGIR